MSKVSISGDVNGTGNFTIKAPATNTDRVFNLPDEAGTVLTNVSDIETQVKTATNATGSAPVYACRAWIDLDGRAGTIRASENISSVTDNGTGRHIVNFATNMPDANYAVATSGGESNKHFMGAKYATHDSSKCELIIMDHKANDFTDDEYVMAAFFR